MSARRDFIRRLAAGGALGAGGLTGFISRALAKGDLPAIPGINRLEGSATVNGKPAKVGTPVTPRDLVATGPRSQAVIVVGGDAFLMRENTVIELGETGGVVSRILVRTGRLLSVFSKKPVEIRARTATIGIRGTGAYLEVEPDRVYLCLCYGEADIAGPGIARPLTVKTTHHERPLYLGTAGPAMRAEPGPFLNHSDDELILLESLVGREPPFAGQYPFKRY